MGKYKSNVLRVLLHKEGGVIVAQCLEYDIAADGRTPVEAKLAFHQLLKNHEIVARKFNTAMFDGINAAPPEFWRMWNEAKAVKSSDGYLSKLIKYLRAVTSSRGSVNRADFWRVNSRQLVS